MEIGAKFGKGHWTWHQVAGATTGPTPDDLNSLGFVSFAAESVTANVAGGERGVFAITENISDPGLRTGRLLLDDGSELYLCAGQGFVDLPLADGRLLTPSSWLDLRWIRRDGRETNLRLWSGDALAAADLAKRAHARQPTIAVAAVAAAPASRRSIRVIAGSSMARRPAETASSPLRRVNWSLHATPAPMSRAWLGFMPAYRSPVVAR